MTTERLRNQKFLTVAKMIDEVLVAVESGICAIQTFNVTYGFEANRSEAAAKPFKWPA